MMIVFNPAAGSRRAQRLWRVLDIMVHSGVKLDLRETTHPGHATELAREAVAQGRPMVVAAGGDGTIAEVAAGLAGSATRLGIIPLGTANVLAHELGLPFAPRQVAAALAFSRTRPIWPGIARKGAAERLFVQMLGAGFDAEVVHRLDPRLKRLLGRTAFVLQGLRETTRYSFPLIDVTLDGEPSQAGNIIVTKGRYYAGHYTIAPQASPFQPGFTVVMFDRTGPFSALAYGTALTLDQIGRMPGIRIRHASHIEIGAVRTQADGDPAVSGPLTIRDAPRPIEVVVGEQAAA